MKRLEYSASVLLKEKTSFRYTIQFYCDHYHSVIIQLCSRNNCSSCSQFCRRPPGDRAMLLLTVCSCLSGWGSLVRWAIYFWHIYAFPKEPNCNSRWSKSNSTGECINKLTTSSNRSLILTLEVLLEERRHNILMLGRSSWAWLPIQKLFHHPNCDQLSQVCIPTDRKRRLKHRRRCTTFLTNQIIWKVTYWSNCESLV